MGMYSTYVLDQNYGFEKVNKPAKIQDFGYRSSNGRLILNSRLNSTSTNEDKTTTTTDILGE